MTNGQIWEELSRLADGEDKFELGRCSVVGCTASLKIDYDLNVRITLFERVGEDAIMVFLDNLSPYQTVCLADISKNIKLSIDGNTLKLQSASFDLIIEQEFGNE